MVGEVGDCWGWGGVDCSGDGLSAVWVWRERERERERERVKYLIFF